MHLHPQISLMPRNCRRLALELDPPDYDELRAFAKERDISMREIVIKCLRACEVITEKGWKPERVGDLEV